MTSTKPSLADRLAARGAQLRADGAAERKVAASGLKSSVAELGAPSPATVFEGVAIAPDVVTYKGEFRPLAGVTAHVETAASSSVDRPSPVPLSVGSPSGVPARSSAR